MSRRPGDVPSLAMVVTGGFGVLVVIAFVAGVILDRSASFEPGDRVAVVRDEADRVVVLAARCADERVRAVEVRPAGQPPLWRLESDKGGIARRFVVRGEPPFGFAVTAQSDARLEGLLEAEVTIDDLVDAESFDPGQLVEGDSLRTSCDGADVGAVEIAFIVGALGVTAAYGVMVWRYARAS